MPARQLLCIGQVFLGLLQSWSDLYLWLSARAPSKLHVAKQVSLKARLRSYGFAGVAAYGLLNTVYYITAFLFFWTHVAKVPRGEILLHMSSMFKKLAVSVTINICLFP